MKVTDKDNIRNNQEHARQISESKGNHIRPWDGETENVQFDCVSLVLEKTKKKYIMKINESHRKGQNKER